jgi:DNA mismatch repair protein MutS
VAAEVERVQATAAAVARLDALCSLAEVAVRNGYTMPQVDASREIRIVEGRHPVVEQTMKDVLFVPNDTTLNDGDDRVAIVTGPNMAGKSTYMRQTALIVLMAQMGSFVPAKSAQIGIVDRVFTRIGASDDLASGQSTFMVEMTEMANILAHATSASLLILDEIGRGTSTYDGMAIARAVLEYCADKRRLGAKTMFATHYHELSALEGEVAGVRNYNITAKKQGGTLVFLRKIVRGAADDSYGIEVAKLAGVPEGVIGKAKGYLKELNEGGTAAIAHGAPKEKQGQLSLSDIGGDEVRDILCATDLNTITPIEAMNLLFELQRKARG